MNKSGFTLLELMVSAALIIILSALGLVAIKTSASSVSVNRSKALLQDEARGLMLQLVREIEIAVKPADVGVTLPLGVQGLSVLNDGNSIRFQIPTNDFFTAFSAPIVYAFQTEDRPLQQAGFELGNAWLDAGEDINYDKVLNRQITRTQSGETQVVGGANSLADANFELVDDNHVLRVSLVLTSPWGDARSQLVRYDIQRDIYLMN